MNSMEKRKKRITRHKRVRAKIFGTEARPRLSVFRGGKNVFLQLIDDATSKTLVWASSSEGKPEGDKTKRAQAAAKLLAKRALEAGIRAAVFDRGGNKFHGRVKAIAETAREAGLKI